MLLAAALAMSFTAAAPAMAQVSQESEQGVESGKATQNVTISGDGNSANRCAQILGATQTGNAVNSTGALQADGGDDEIEVEDSGSLTISPALAEKCEQEINQAAASSKAEAPKAPPKAAPAPKAEARATTPEGKAEATQAKGEAKTGAKKELPKTGGDNATLFVLGVGTLLVAGGLLARRIGR
jgi:LPXTG-motif cell wall-anchored protein